MAKRLADSVPSPMNVFKMVKRLRFSLDEQDFYFADAPSTASSEASFKDCAEDNTMILKMEEEQATKPSPIKYQEGFPKLLFQDLQSNNANVVLNASKELDDLLSGETATPEKLRDEFLVLGGHSVLVTTMQRWTNHGVIQSNLCRCIAGMIATLNTSSASGHEGAMDLVSSLLLMGALDQITKCALMQYPNFPDIQLDAMVAVTQLCGGGCDGESISASSREATKKFVRDLDGVSLVTKTMRVFAGIEEVQERGCGLLNSLCRAGDHEEAVTIKKVALKVVAGSVQSYPDNHKIELDAHDLMNAVLSGGDKDEAEELE